LYSHWNRICPHSFPANLYSEISTGDWSISLGVTDVRGHKNISGKLDFSNAEGALHVYANEN
jgi:hypothetical protein